MTTGLKFELDKLVRELAVIGDLAKPFLTASGARELDQSMWRLRALPRDDPAANWEVSVPVETRPSCGDFAADGKGELTVTAHLTTTWDLLRSDQKTVEIRDNVSTVVSFRAGSDENECEIARFTMDIAAVKTAPGCGLHMQVKNHPEWFPADLDVPRFPMFVPTFGSVLEFVLGELFQHEWTKHVAGHKSNNGWRELQQELWLNWLSWQQAVVRQSAVSPWLDIKAARCAALGPHA